MAYKKDIATLYAELNTSEQGLTSAEAALRLNQNGKNLLEQGKKTPAIIKFLSQFKDVMILVLLVAAAISATFGILHGQPEELIDTAIILVIVLINAVIGFVQEDKAEKALESLKSMSTPFSKVIRNGQIVKIKSEELVVGDIVVLEAGDIAPADIRVIESASLKVSESALTGESASVDKDISTIDKEVPIGDRKNMIYSSGVINYGRGKGIVTAVGMHTEVGKIASMLQVKEEPTPLQQKLDKTGKIISVGVLAIAVIIFIFTLAIEHPTEGNKYVDALMTAVAIAVAAIPEGLPAVVTIVMAMGVTRLSKRNAIIRKLPAVETLGCTQIICSDKTGTLTLNRMTVKQTSTLNAEQELLMCMTLCNDAVFNGNTSVGDPTETALIEYSLQKGLNKSSADTTYNRIDERPFDSVRKLMTTVNMVNGKKVAYTKGATDELLSLCTTILDNGNVRPLTDADRKRIQQTMKDMALGALRVLGYAYSANAEIEKNLTFIGLTGMIDPPRPEVKDAIKTCKSAGLKAIMITGDHRDTAMAIAKELNMIKSESEVVTGKEIDAMSDAEFEKAITGFRVYARVSPENKVRIVKTWRKIGKIVAMTGDGVNDAPSIKNADIGIGMGITGTDVTKNIADMVLTDDNFATIVFAVEEGRKIYNNIEKAIQFLLSANIAEVLGLFIITMFYPQLRFLFPVQILWVNLVTDSFPALALGSEKSEKDIMTTPPRASKNNIFAGKLGIDIIYQGALQAAIVIGVFLWGNASYNNAIATTMALVSLSMIQLFHSFNMRSNHNSIFKMNLYGNPMLWLSMGVGFVLTICIVALPFLQPIFRTSSLNMTQWAVSLLFPLLIIPLVELGKLIERKFAEQPVVINND